jgi:hypothetical protein
MSTGLLIYKIINMQRKGLGLLMAAAAAYGYYKYSKMTPDQKKDLRMRGKSFLDKNLGGLGNLFGRKTANTANHSATSF